MSDAVGTILKIISSIASPKAAVKFIAIAIILLLSWGHLNDLIESLGTASEHKNLIMLFLALGTGSIVGEIVSVLGEIMYKYSIGKYFEVRQKKKSIKEKKEYGERLLTHFKLTYKHLSFSTKEILWDLSKEPQTIWDDDESYIPVRSLIENGYIKQISSLSAHENLYKLHPYISTHLKNNIEKEIDNIINVFISENNNELINTITSSDYLPHSAYSDFSKIANEACPVIAINKDYESIDFSNKVIGFDISINKYFKASLGEKLQKKIYTRKFKVNGEEINAA
ncbi:hypothetical protein QMW88_19505 [Cronobacter dublinensis]|uniref:hypothetical protein n=1 Tax=Cronobacter dublinensis TaxID=413497 RepID=UPI000519AAF4|nr:hypothetical protein [Cronobacter dublinensis]MDI6440303.1 hypothetical protein [Cronobacter dublinensis]MDK1194717.1 hypothetical protein [Cronobacter dublinensis]MDK1203419.1 hypothetical protein [Cronobacter dublinensis]